MKISYEMAKLRQLLDARNIEWKDKSEILSDEELKRRKLLNIPDTTIYRTWFKSGDYQYSVIFGHGSYGFNNGLLECLSMAIDDRGEPVGNLTADDIIKVVDRNSGIESPQKSWFDCIIESINDKYAKIIFDKLKEETLIDSKDTLTQEHNTPIENKNCSNCKHYQKGFCGYKKNGGVACLTTEMECWELSDDAKADVLHDEVPEHDAVSHPSHYTSGGIECIDCIKAALGKNFIGFLIGNVIKYSYRYKDKNGVEDLKKARWYLDRAIKELENEQT